MAFLNVVTCVRIVYSGKVLSYKLYTMGVTITRRTCVYNLCNNSTYNNLNEADISCMLSTYVESNKLT